MSIDKQPQYEQQLPLDIVLSDLLSDCDEIIARHVRALPCSVFELSDEEQQDLVDRINKYIEFELNQCNIPSNIPLRIDGHGMLLISDMDGRVLGAEVVSGGDIVLGELDDICVLPVPTLECILHETKGEIPNFDQTLSMIILLKKTTYKTGILTTGSFETEHNLHSHQIGIPLMHNLRVSVDDQHITV